jgi:nucleotide-binding universal stress UspA family protein
MGRPRREARGVRRYSLRQVDAQPVICAFDASRPARRAVEAAAWLAGALRAPLEVIHVFDAGAQAALPRHEALLDHVSRGTLRLRIDERTRARMRRIQQSVVEPLPDNDVKTLVLDGLVVPTLHDAAAERRAMLLVSGTAARGGLEHVLKGSVAGTLAANAPCPVMTVPPDAAIAEPGPVLVGDDGSDHARRAVHHAAALADRLGRELVRMEADGDDPVQGLAAAGREQRACLIATGTRGRGPIRAELLGSVSSGLVQTAERPVMLVPASAGEAPARGD